MWCDWDPSMQSFLSSHNCDLGTPYSVPMEAPKKKKTTKRKWSEVVPRSERHTLDREVWGVWSRFWTGLARHITETHGDDKIMPDRAGPSRAEDSAMRKGTERARLASRVFAKTGPGKTFTDGFLPSYTKDCVIKQGTHSSNHIWWGVDLVRRVYWQTCHNYTCAAAKRTTYPLPSDLVDLAKSALTRQTLAKE